MAKVAVFHNTLDFEGGADMVCLHVCAALDAVHDVTLFTLSATAPERVAAKFDVPFDVTVATPPGSRALAAGLNRAAPRLGPQLPARSVLLRAYLRRRRGEFDVVVSTANELAISGPSVQYVHFPQFYGDRVDAGETGPLDGLWSRLAAPDRSQLEGPTRLLANSAWTADVTADIYGVRPTVCHPPVDPIEGRPWVDRDAGVLVLGRIAPDKRVLNAIEVVERLRARGYDLTCRVVGSAPTAYREYVRRVESAAARSEGVRVETDVSRDRVETLLGRYRYGLNMKPTEHFGMAVAEYAAAGMVPFAPNEGGQVDVLGGDDRLLFHGIEGAVETVAAALDSDLRPFLSRDRFASDRFASEIREHVSATLN
ncbi:glycosyltransferase family 4 protein [Halosegnis longus]|uniref:Glycosyltransferase n=1 Tax=Halosegnis longus TaxID=2216012 RepID=A0AAJ4UVH6_9EURY|nr:glycosyltransferase [Salella cibi]